MAGARGAFEKVRFLITTARMKENMIHPFVNWCKLAGNGFRIPRACLKSAKKRPFGKPRKKRSLVSITSNGDLIYPADLPYKSANLLDLQNHPQITGNPVHGTRHGHRLKIWDGPPRQPGIPTVLTVYAFFMFFGVLVCIMDRKRILGRKNKRHVRRRLSAPETDVTSVDMEQDFTHSSTVLPTSVADQGQQNSTTEVSANSSSSSAMDCQVRLEQPLETMIQQLCGSFDTTQVRGRQQARASGNFEEIRHPNFGQSVSCGDIKLLPQGSNAAGSERINNVQEMRGYRGGNSVENVRIQEDRNKLLVIGTNQDIDMEEISV